MSKAQQGAPSCPHCGDPMPAGLARHMVQNCEAVDEADKAGTPARGAPYSGYERLPALEDAPDRVEPRSESREERRRLAQQLTDADVWV